MSAVATITETVRNAAQALHWHSDSPRLDAELLIVDQRALQSRAFAVAERGLDQIERQRLSAAAVGRAIPEQQRRSLRGISNFSAPLALLRRLARGD